MNGQAHYIVLHLACVSFIGAAIGSGLTACYEPDPHSVRGALAASARALEVRDGRELYRIIDQRGRAAMIAIVHARREAARLIRSEYPDSERAAALTALGDARSAIDAADLFTQRCAEPCMSELAAAVGAPIAEHKVGGDEVEVQTTRGGRLRLHRGKDGWWGLVWNTQALSEERTRAARELIQIRHNATVYRRRRVLEAK
jgi:hypothetical protein